MLESASHSLRHAQHLRNGFEEMSSANDPLIIAGKAYNSRLLVGTGKYKDFAETQAAIKAGKTADQAAASLNLSAKYPSYKAERLKPAVQAIYDELAKK